MDDAQEWGRIDAKLHEVAQHEVKLVEVGIDLIFEPGRLLAADAGWYATEVLDLKTTHGRIPAHAWVLIRTDWSHRKAAREFPCIKP